MESVTKYEKQSWDHYQSKKVILERIEKYNLKKYLDKTKTVLDIGCNAGEFCLELVPFVKDITGVEPIVQLPNSSKNCIFMPITFRDFHNNHKKQYNVILTFAVSNQICRYDQYDIPTYVKCIIDLLIDDGILIVESHKLKDRHKNQNHNKVLIDNFKKYLTLIEERNGRSNGSRKLYIFMKSN